MKQSGLDLWRWSEGRERARDDGETLPRLADVALTGRAPGGQVSFKLNEPHHRQGHLSHKSLLVQAILRVP